MGVKKLEDLIAWQLSEAFKLAVYGLVHASPTAVRDLRWKSQLLDAVSDAEADVAEGWKRYLAGDFHQFLSYAKASNLEGQRRLADGVARRHFTSDSIVDAATLGRRAGAAISGLQRSLRPFRKHPHQRQRPFNPKP